MSQLILHKIGQAEKLTATEEEVEVDVPFAIIEDVPLFPGCEGVAKDKRKDCFQEKIQAHIRKNFQYPEAALDAGHQGKVFVSFVIEKDGSITDVKLLREFVKCPECDKEAMRVVQAMPKWIPGIQYGRAVKVQFNIPIKFNLR